MGHHGRTHLSLFDPLFEVFHGNIGPEVPVEVNQDGIDASHAIEQGCQVVIMLYLCGGLLAFQAQGHLYKVIGKSCPVGLRIGHGMGIEISRGTAELGGNWNGFKHCNLNFQSLHEYANLLSKAGWRGRLAMGAGQHRHIVPFSRQAFELLNNPVEQGKVGIVQGQPDC